MRRYRVGIIGGGAIFPMHAQSLKKIKSVELAAVCDIKPRVARARARAFGCMPYTDYRKMLTTAALDAVHVCTPHYLHAPMTIEAAKSGVHVLCEKPMAITPEDAAKALEAARRYGVKLGVIFQNRFNPGSQLVKENLENGRLGRIKAARIVLSYHKPDAYYARSDWKGTRKKEGGGVVIDQSIHFLDLLRWFADDEVASVEAHVANRMHRRIEVEDCAEGVIRFRRGAYVCFYLINCYSYDDDVEVELDCAKGRVNIIKDSARIGLYSGRTLSASPGKHEYIDYGDGVKDYWGFCHYHQIREFYDALARGREPAVNGLDGLKTQRIVWAIYESSRRKKKIRF